jgi:hypothetical protein
MSGRCDEEDDLTLVYMWARKEAEDEIERLTLMVEERNHMLAAALAKNEELSGALRVIDWFSDCHETARQIARAALGEDK